MCILEYERRIGIPSEYEIYLQLVYSLTCTWLLRKKSPAYCPDLSHVYLSPPYVTMRQTGIGSTTTKPNLFRGIWKHGTSTEAQCTNYSESTLTRARIAPMRTQSNVTFCLIWCRQHTTGIVLWRIRVLYTYMNVEFLLRI